MESRYRFYSDGSVVEEDDITESTEKLETYGTTRQFDIILDIVKINTELSVGDQL